MHLLHEIEAFLAKQGMSATNFGRLAVNDGKLVSRLRSSANVTLRTVDRARAFMASAETQRVASSSDRAAA